MQGEIMASNEHAKNVGNNVTLAKNVGRCEKNADMSVTMTKKNTKIDDRNGEGISRTDVDFCCPFTCITALMPPLLCENRQGVLL